MEQKHEVNMTLADYNYYCQDINTNCSENGKHYIYERESESDNLEDNENS